MTELCPSLGTLVGGYDGQVTLRCHTCGWELPLGEEATLTDVVIAETEHVSYVQQPKLRAVEP